MLGPIDREHLARATMGDADLEREILLLFCDQLKTQIANLREPIDSAALAIALHTLKGAAFGVGANKVGEIARRGEEEIRRSGGIGAALHDELENAAREAIQFIEETTAHR